MCTVLVAVALMLPAASVARTLKRCAPLACASQVLGEAQVGSHVAFVGNNWHSNRACRSALLKFSVGVLSRLGVDGNGDVMETVGAVVSTVKVSVGETRSPARA
jgi:hypothetical protein